MVATQESKFCNSRNIIVVSAIFLACKLSKGYFAAMCSFFGWLRRPKSCCGSRSHDDPTPAAGPYWAAYTAPI